MEWPVIFFDNTCVLCSRSVRFVLRNDSKGRFRFASLDSATFSEISDLVPSQGKKSDSVVLFSAQKLYFRSSAVLRIAMQLRFPIPLLTAAFIVPPFIRNRIYDWIAHNRYRWFGKTPYCFVPSPETADRFLD